MCVSGILNRNIGTDCDIFCEIGSQNNSFAVLANF